MSLAAISSVSRRASHKFVASRPVLKAFALALVFCSGSSRSTLVRSMGGMGETEQARNVLGTKLETCSVSPMTGYYRDGCCNTGPIDTGRHVVCARLTEEFLTYTKGQGNDLSTPRPEYGFPGLKPGDQWCLCASRWKEAYDAGVAPPVILNATSEAALRYVTIEELVSKSYSPEEAS